MAERWHEITGYFDETKQEVVDMGGERLIVRGDIDNVIIVSVPSTLGAASAHRVMQQVQETMKGGGVNRPMVLMPDFVKLLRVKKLSAAETARIQAAAKAAAEPPKPPPTKH
jgi:protein required for attachment to host cells